MRFLTCLVLCGMGLTTQGQYDLGVSAGGYAFVVYANKAHRPGSTVRFNSGQSLPWTAALHYRERSTRKVDLGAELRYVHREFQMRTQGGGMDHQYLHTMNVALDLLYMSILPEYSLDDRGISVVRCGPQIGFKFASSTVEGRLEEWSLPEFYKSTVVPSGPANDFRGDVRILVGLGLRYPMGRHLALAIDPYWSIALSSMLKWEVASVGMGGHDMGLSIGLAWARPGLGLWRSFRAGAPVKNKGMINDPAGIPGSPN